MVDLMNNLVIGASYDFYLQLHYSHWDETETWTCRNWSCSFLFQLSFLDEVQRGILSGDSVALLSSMIFTVKQIVVLQQNLCAAKWACTVYFNDHATWIASAFSTIDLLAINSIQRFHHESSATILALQWNVLGMPACLLSIWFQKLQSSLYWSNLYLWTTNLWDSIIVQHNIFVENKQQAEVNEQMNVQLIAVLEVAVKHLQVSIPFLRLSCLPEEVSVLETGGNWPIGRPINSNYQLQLDSNCFVFLFTSQPAVSSLLYLLL